ncbi:MAG TPA: PAS domain-containing sensor histidine kinase, partial [Flavisolibacter sp.]|nr:PAS domain-containing sensor histidine kinase [Flavisolibacter sp.]
SEMKFRSLVQNGYEIITIIGTDGTYTYHSESLYRILGYHPHELIGKSPLDIVHPDDVEKVVNATKKIKEGDFVNNGIPYRLRTADGSYKWVESSATNMIHDPFIKGIVVNTRDVTEKIILKQQLQKEKDARQREIAVSVIHAQEMERTRLGQELHDNVNQVLTTIKLYNEVCMNEDRTNKALLGRSVKQINYCIETLRDISKNLSTSNVLEVGLKGSIRDLVDSVNTTQRLAIRLFIEDIQEGEINPDLKVTIYRIVQEQLTNILKHAYTDVAEIHLSATASHVYLRILDEGTGFDPKKKKKGIGLTNLANRVEAFNGKMEICSSPGKGCLLKVDFPLPPTPKGEL